MFQQRELEYRAWDKKLNKFATEGDFIFSQYGDVEFQFHPNSLEYAHDEFHHGDYPKGRFLVTEYTGRKDTEGKKIFTADIVRSLTHNFIGYVYFDTSDACYFVQEVGSHVDAGVYDADKRKETRWSLFLPYKVIGNTFENPELLEAAEQKTKEIKQDLSLASTVQKINQFAIEKIHSTYYSDEAKNEILLEVPQFAVVHYSLGRKGLSVNYVHNSSLVRHEKEADNLRSYIIEQLQIKGWNDMNNELAMFNKGESTNDEK